MNENDGLPDIITCCRFSLHDASPLKDSLMDLSTTNAAGAVYDTYLNSFRNEDGSVNWLPVCADAHGFVVNKDLLKSMIFLFQQIMKASFLPARHLMRWVSVGFLQTIIMIIPVWKHCRDLSASELSTVDGRKWRTIYSDPGNTKREGLDSIVWP